jgi:hypothetical protein
LPANPAQPYLVDVEVAIQGENDTGKQNERKQAKWDNAEYLKKSAA